MFDRVHRQICESVRRSEYVVTIHAEEEIAADKLTIFDVESALLAGQITERQRDAATGEWKYLVRGPSLMGKPVVVTVKLSVAKEAVIITVYSI